MVKCVHCGTALDREPVEAMGRITADPVAVTGPVDQVLSAPAAPATAPATAPPFTPGPWAPPADDPGAVIPTSAITARPSESPRTSVRRTDGTLMVASVIVLIGAVVAYSSASLPWIRARLSTHDGVPVARLTFRGADTFAGPMALGVAVALLLLGLVWFWNALDGGAGVPRLAHPAMALLACVIGVTALAVMGLVWTLWDEAFVARARESGMTKAAMRALLGSRPAPTIAVERLSGAYRFGAAVLLALVAGTIAWWSQRRRA